MTMRNPFVSFLACLPGISGTWDPELIGYELAQIQERSAKNMEDDRLNVAQALLPTVQDPATARQALELLVTRWPSVAALHKYYREGQASGGCDAIALALIERGASLEGGLDVNKSLPAASMDLGHLLLFAGVDIPLDKVPAVGQPQDQRLLMLQCASMGLMGQAVGMIQAQTDPSVRQEWVDEVWSQATAWDLPDPQILMPLPDPSGQWWKTAQEKFSNYRSGARIARFLVQRNPDLLDDMIDGAFATGTLDWAEKTPQALERIAKRERFQSPQGWTGTALQVAMSTFLRHGSIRQATMAKQLADELARMVSLLDPIAPDPTMQTLRTRLLSIVAKAKGKEKIKALKSSPAEYLRETMDLLPVLPSGLPDPGLLFAVSLAAGSKPGEQEMLSKLPALASLPAVGGLSSKNTQEEVHQCLDAILLMPQRKRGEFISALSPGPGQTDDIAPTVEMLAWLMANNRLSYLAKGKPFEGDGNDSLFRERLDTIISRFGHEICCEQVSLRTPSRLLMDLMSRPELGLREQFGFLYEHHILRETTPDVDNATRLRRRI